MLEIGHVTKPHGLRGEVIVKLVSNRHERMAPGSVLVTDRGPLTICRAAPHQHGWIVQFDGVTTRDEAEGMRGMVLSAEPLDLPDELWVHELVDAEVRDTAGVLIGRCVTVEENPASDLIVLDSGGLVPLRFVVEHRPGTVVVDPPAGLLEG